MTSPAELITHSATPTDLDTAQVRDLAARVEAVDGAPPLDEQADLRLAHPVPGITHVFVRGIDPGGTDPGGTGRLLGYAQIDGSQVEGAQLDGSQTESAQVEGAHTEGTEVDGADPAGPATAEILVGPDGARPDLAATLFAQAENCAGAADLLVWARGDASPVRAEAERRDYVAARTLLTLARPLNDTDTGSVSGAVTDTGAGHAQLPDGVTIRAFRPGADDAAWLGVNARAFAAHPEQGRWTQADLSERVEQPWFDPAGFLLAVTSDRHLLGFHWTKRHSPELGEVYVIGTDPAAQGRGLGAVLLQAGLDYLRDTGTTSVILYTDEENRGAVRLYQRSGFTVIRRQTQYRRPKAAHAA